MTARELLHKIPDALETGTLDEDGVIQYDISEPVYHVVKSGRLEAHDGVAESPDVTVRTTDDNLLKLLRGELSPSVAFMTGKLKVNGDLMLAQRLVSHVDRAKVAALG